MAEIGYWTQPATEQFPPRNLVRQATGVERAGFDAGFGGAETGEERN